MDPIIRVDHLVKRYKKAQVPAVDDISFDVGPGELFAFLGPNGAGKTTTISILTTTLAKTSGHGHDRRPRPRPRGEGRPAQHRDHLPEPERRPAPVGRGEHPAPRRDLRAVRLPAVLPDDAGRVPPADRAAGRRRRAGRRPGQAAQDVLGRHEAQARDHPLPDAPAGRPLPRRADLRARPGQPAEPVGVPARGPQRRRHDGLPDDPLPRGGRGGRPRLRHRPRPDLGHRHAGRAEARSCSIVRSCSTPSTGRRSSPSSSALGLTPDVSTRPASSASPTTGRPPRT